MRVPYAAAMLGIAMALSACQTPVFKKQELSQDVLGAELRKQEIGLLQYQLRQYERLTNVAYPIYREGVAMCGEKIIRMAGFVAKTPKNYPDKEREAAIEAFGLGDLPVVIQVIKGSPAKGAGLKSGDTIVSFDDTPILSGESSGESFKKNVLAFSSSRSEVFNLTVRRAGKEIEFSIRPDVLCDYPILLSSEDARGAFADGKSVIVTTGMLRFVENDDELAHNTMRHINKKSTNQAAGMAAGVVLDVLAAIAGVNTQGGFTRSMGNLGGQAYSQDFESEADHVGLYYLARAGYDIDSAAPFWRRMGAARSDVEELKISSLHPTSSERFLRLEKSAAEIKAKIAAGKPLVPEFDKEAPWLEKAPPKSEPDDENPSS